MSNDNSSNVGDADDTGETFEVRVAIYDLSRGMARSLSGQLLGPQYAIDAIPHTVRAGVFFHFFYEQSLCLRRFTFYLRCSHYLFPNPLLNIILTSSSGHRCVWLGILFWSRNSIRRPASFSTVDQHVSHSNNLAWSDTENPPSI
jgi:hypothetical protein